LLCFANTVAICYSLKKEINNEINIFLTLQKMPTVNKDKFLLSFWPDLNAHFNNDLGAATLMIREVQTDCYD
jgi:hypothetical protein